MVLQLLLMMPIPNQKFQHVPDRSSASDHQPAGTVPEIPGYLEPMWQVCHDFGITHPLQSSHHGKGPPTRREAIKHHLWGAVHLPQGVHRRNQVQDRNTSDSGA